MKTHHSNRLFWLTSSLVVMASTAFGASACERAVRDFGDPNGTDDTAQGGSDNSATGGTPGAAGNESQSQNAPVPGGSGVLSLSDQTFVQATLTWSEATDSQTSSSELEYRVYRSLEANIDTLAEIESNGEALSAFAAGRASATVELEGGVDNYFNVVVRNGSGQRAAYAMVGAPFNERDSCTEDGECFSGDCRISFRDKDGDGYGDDNDTTGRCNGSIPAGYVSMGGDCCDDGGNLDTAALIHPGQTEFFATPASLCGIAWDYNCSRVIERSPTALLVGCAAGATVPDCPSNMVPTTEADCGQMLSQTPCTQYNPGGPPGCGVPGGGLVAIRCN